MPSRLKKALVVDDDPIARELVAACLGAFAALEILPAGNAEEAIEIAEAQRVDLIVADLNMPDTDGVEMLATLAQHSSGAMVFVVVLMVSSAFLTTLSSFSVFLTSAST